MQPGLREPPRPAHSSEARCIALAASAGRCKTWVRELGKGRVSREEASMSSEEQDSDVAALRSAVLEAIEQHTDSTAFFLVTLDDDLRMQRIAWAEEESSEAAAAMRFVLEVTDQLVTQRRGV